jgi:hypothetical protein
VLLPGHSTVILMIPSHRVRSSSINFGYLGVAAALGVKQSLKHRRPLMGRAMTGKEMALPALSEQWPAKDRTKTPNARP